MRRAFLGVVGAMAAGPGHAETYSFTTLINGMWQQQTLIHCQEPARMSGRMPERCTLNERASAYPNRNYPKTFDPGVACAAGHPITFHPNGTLAYCKLDGVQTFATRDPPGYAVCSGYVTFDRDGIAECD
jgi:hypothetical protein